jgi:hypothetical protein
MEFTPAVPPLMLQLFDVVKPAARVPTFDVQAYNSPNNE